VAREFDALCERVRSLDRTWDWKMTALKNLVHVYSRAHGWDIKHQTAPREPRDGDLFRNVGFLTWNDVLHLPDALSEPAAFYAGYARGDGFDCIQWQLAQPAMPLEANPFAPLLRLYAEGYYPFGITHEHVVLFSFA
jgi:hypothetical protein